jgi:hypothetical protein
MLDDVNPPPNSPNTLRWLAAAVLAASSGWLACTLDTRGELEVVAAAGAEADASAAIGGAGGTAGQGGSLQQGGSGGLGGSPEAGGAGGQPNGGAGGSSAGSGGAPLAEDCANGVDDNGDGLKDCEDPACKAGFVCVPIPPSEWGPVGFVRDRAPAAPSTDCGAYAPADIAMFDGIEAPAGGCTCGCAAPAGGVCQVGATLFQYATCSGGAAQQPNGCYDFSKNGWVIGSVSTLKPTLSTAGVCAASASGSPQAPAWKSAVDLCTVVVAGAGCGDSHMCVPRPPAPLGPAACVQRAGTVDCPDGYPQQRILYDAMQDNRTCAVGSCTCGSATGQVCDVSVSLYKDAGCANHAGTYKLDGYCHATGFAAGAVGSSRFTGQTTGGACTSGGAASVIGDVTPINARSMCCTSP